MHVRSNLLNDMLSNISDPKLRDTYAQVISGKFPFIVYCMDPQINPATGLSHEAGVLIGYVRRNGKTVEEVVVDEDGTRIAALVSSRDRFDGQKGFRCLCGNSSIVCPEEADIVVPGWFPNKADLTKIAKRLEGQVKKAKALTVGSSVEYDGFRVEEVAG